MVDDRRESLPDGEAPSADVATTATRPGRYGNDRDGTERMDIRPTSSTSDHFHPDGRGRGAHAMSIASLLDADSGPIPPLVVPDGRPEFPSANRHTALRRIAPPSGAVYDANDTIRIPYVRSRDGSRDHGLGQGRGPSDRSPRSVTRDIVHLGHDSLADGHASMGRDYQQADPATLMDGEEGRSEGEARTGERCHDGLLNPVSPVSYALQGDGDSAQSDSHSQPFLQSHHARQPSSYSPDRAIGNPDRSHENRPDPRPLSDDENNDNAAARPTLWLDEYALSIPADLDDDLVEAYRMGIWAAVRAIQGGRVGVQGSFFPAPVVMAANQGPPDPLNTSPPRSSLHMLENRPSGPHSSSWPGSAGGRTVRTIIHPPPPGSRPSALSDSGSAPPSAHLGPRPDSRASELDPHADAAASSSSNTSDRPLGPLQLPQNVRRVISCFACRERKTRCDGGQPCETCARRDIGSECEYATHVRRRGKGQRKRRNERERSHEDDGDGPGADGMDGTVLEGYG